MSRLLAPARTVGARPRTRSLLGVVAVGIGGFAALAALLRRSELEAIDRAVTVRMQATCRPALEPAMSFVSWFGFPPQGRVLPVAAAAVLWLMKRRLEALLQLAAWGTAPLASIMKSLARRPRPVPGKGLRVVAVPLGGSSFPSGHVLTYVGVYGWMAIMADRLVRPPVLRRLAVAALTALIAAVGPSRVYLGHHRPSDVLASYLLGSSYLAALVVAYRRLRTRGAPQ